MRKYLMVLAAVALIAGGLLVMSGCSSRDSDLVGVWAWDGDSSITTTFNADGTGTHSMNWTGFGTSFNWSTSGNNIIWNYPNQPRMRTEYNVSNDVWSFTMGDGTVFRYNRVR